jgi:hypothetical protein
MTPAPRSLAVLATMPGREAALAVCLASLRPQVQQLRVICHDMTEPPECVERLADEWRCEPDTRGSAAKLEWAQRWPGLYLGCDDDLEYPPDYAATMLRWVRRWKGRALVTCHGRVLRPRSTGFLDIRMAVAPRQRTGRAWLNYPGGCGLAFDTRLAVPEHVPSKNLEEVHLAVWAQRQRVPIFLVPHSAGWLRYLLPEGHTGPTIWAEEKGARFANRDAVIRPWSAAHEWRVYRA